MPRKIESQPPETTESGVFGAIMERIWRALRQGKEPPDKTGRPAQPPSEKT